MSILELKDVCYSYNSKNLVLRGMTCQFEQGKLYALVGQSGAGKSTALSLMAGLDKPKSGDVFFDGTNTREMNLTSYRLNKVAVIYQDFELFPMLTVLENIMYPLRMAGVQYEEAKEEAIKLCEKVYIPERLYDHYPSEISGGEQQRVSIARGLTMDRKLMLADEPTGNLDYENSENIINLLLDLAHHDNRCIIVVTHDLGVMDKADVVYRLKEGIVTEGVK